MLVQRCSPAARPASCRKALSSLGGVAAPRPASAFQRGRVTCSSDAAGAMAMPSEPSGSKAEAKEEAKDDEPQEQSYTPFSRLNDKDPYSLLGVGSDAAFDEVVEARNFLLEEYRWHAPSREAIELAYEAIIQKHYKDRMELGFKTGTLSKRAAVYEGGSPSLGRRIADLFDPNVTLVHMINEGIVFVGLALWCLVSTGDQSFPLAGAFAYSVYKFQNKRTKLNPDGPFFGGNPIVGALISTLFAIGVGCAVCAAINVPLLAMVEGSLRNIQAFICVMSLGLFNVTLK